MLCMFLGLIERWETLASRLEQTNALHRELAAIRMDVKAMHNRLYDYEIALKQPHVLEDHINGINVSFFSYLPMFVTTCTCVYLTAVSEKPCLRVTSGN